MSQKPKKGAFERWLDVFETAWRRPRKTSGLRYPSCGARALSLVYVLLKPAGRDRALFAFCCSSCLTALVPNISPVPPGTTCVAAGSESIPNYKTVMNEQE